MFGFGKSKLDRAIDAGLADGTLGLHLRRAGVSVKSSRDVRSVISLADRFLSAQAGDPILEQTTALASLIGSPGSRSAAEALQEDGADRLVDIVKRFADTDGEPDATTLIMCLRVAIGYVNPRAVAAWFWAAQHPRLCEAGNWFTVFQTLTHDHPALDAIISHFAETPPRRFAEVSYLDQANMLAREHGLNPHPFNNAAGIARLESWLVDRDPEKFSYAHSATATLPFIDSPDRDRLMGLAMDHTDTGVQLESAWASAKMGSESGVKVLARFCENVNTAITAARYLVELDREDAIPPAAMTDEFFAMATMSNWLAHPNEYGRNPDRITVHDCRELHWPPCGDRRVMCLLRYEFDPIDESDEEENDDASRETEVGFGLVGGLTAWSFWETLKPDWPAEDMYALHCSWESMHDSSEAGPQHIDKYSVEHGRAILREHNDGF